MNESRIELNNRYTITEPAQKWVEQVNQQPDLVGTEVDHAKVFVRLSAAFSQTGDLIDRATDLLVDHYQVYLPKPVLSHERWDLARGLNTLTRIEAVGVDPIIATQEHQAVVQRELLKPFSPHDFVLPTTLEKFINLMRLAVVWHDTPLVINSMAKRQQRLEEMTIEEFLASDESSSYRQRVEDIQKWDKQFPRSKRELSDQEKWLSGPNYEKAQLAQAISADIPHAEEQMRSLIIEGVKDNFGLLRSPNNIGPEVFMSALMQYQTAKKLQEVALTYPPAKSSTGQITYSNRGYTLEQALEYPNERNLS